MQLKRIDETIHWTDLAQIWYNVSDPELGVNGQSLLGSSLIVCDWWRQEGNEPGEPGNRDLTDANRNLAAHASAQMTTLLFLFFLVRLPTNHVTLLAWCRFNVCDVGTTSSRHGVNVLCDVRSGPRSIPVEQVRPDKPTSVCKFLFGESNLTRPNTHRRRTRFMLCRSGCSLGIISHV